MVNMKKISKLLIISFLLLIVSVNVASAQNSSTCSVSGSSISFCNPLQFNTVEDVLLSLLNYLQGIIVVVSLIFIVVGAVLYITSSGDENRITMARKAITAALVGLAIGIAAPTFLNEIYIILEAKQVPSQVGTATPLATIALNTLNFLLSIVGVIALIMLVSGGIMYLTAAGSEDQIDKGKKLVKAAIIGIAIALGALVMTKQIALFFT
jgi:hypothetical protein